MKFVSDGPRNRTVRFLSYSVFIALFAVLLGAGSWQANSSREPFASDDTAENQNKDPAPSFCLL